MTRSGSALRILAAAAGCIMVLSACGMGGAASDSASPTAAAESAAPAAAPGGPITIGAFNFGESRILAHLYAGALAAAGYEPNVLELTNREVVQPALAKGEVQVVPEYLGTLTEFLNAKVNGPDPAPLASGDVAATFAQLQTLAAAAGITVLPPSPAADQNAFAVTKAFAEANSLTTLSELATYSAAAPVTLGGPPECPTRPFCQPGLEKTYGLKVGSFVALDAGGPLTKAALSQGVIDVGLVFSSDGGVAANNFLVLTDDKSLQTVDNIVAAINSAAFSPAIESALNAVNAALTTDDLIQMNKAVDIDRADPAAVAREWLAAKGLAGSNGGG
ncbi:MAG: ABC transporter substrate-binding protein [Actinomycetales bacterium]|nr:ABC transporter substrate-binding protein [Actinomycetales bacterium]